MPGVPLCLFSPPYKSLEPVIDSAAHPGCRTTPGSALVWNLEEGEWGKCFNIARVRAGGIALIVILPRAEEVARDRDVLRIVELCRPHTILPPPPELNAADLRTLLCR